MSRFKGRKRIEQHLSEVSSHFEWAMNGLRSAVAMVQEHEDAPSERTQREVLLMDGWLSAVSAVSENRALAGFPDARAAILEELETRMHAFLDRAGASDQQQSADAVDPQAASTGTPSTRV